MSGYADYAGRFAGGGAATADTLLVPVRERQRPISLDPNVRLNLAPDIQRWRTQRFPRVRRMAHLIKV